MTPEKNIQNKAMEYLKKLEKEGKPVYVERRQAGGFAYKMGIADLYAVIDGIHIEIEVKRPGGQLRPLQEKWRDRMINNGTPCIVVDDVEYLKQIINKWFIGNKEE